LQSWLGMRMPDLGIEQYKFLVGYVSLNDVPDFSQTKAKVKGFEFVRLQGEPVEGKMAPVPRVPAHLRALFGPAKSAHERIGEGQR